jgi:hypothetical protein
MSYRENIRTIDLLKNVIEHEVLSEIFGPKKEVAE